MKFTYFKILFSHSNYQIRFTLTGNYAESEKATTSFGLESVSLIEFDIVKGCLQNYWTHFSCLETDYCIQRARAYAPFCDLIWMETGKPGIRDAKIFSEGVRKVFPSQMLAYNLSPSFNWDASGMSDGELASFNDTLGKLGYTWQFITLAGFHANGLQITKLARSFGDRGMLAYVQDIQRQERNHKVELLTHQKWSGAELVDEMVNVASGGASSTAAMGAGVTEAQFSSKH